MSTTYAALIDSVIAKTMGAARPLLTFVVGDLDDVSTDVALRRVGGTTLTPGAVLEVDTELCYVLTVNATSGEATVVRGWGGTEATGHVDATAARINPRFSRHEAIDEFWVECSASYPNIGRPHTSRIATLPGDSIVAIALGDYDGAVPELDSLRTGIAAIPGSVVGDLLAARSNNGYGSSNVRAQVRQSVWFMDGSGAQVPYGQLVLANPAPAAGTLDVTVMVPYDAGITPETIRDDEDMESLLGASRSAINALVLGTVFRLMQTRVVQRTDIANQNESRSHDEVTVGDMATVIERLRIIRDRARAEAAQQLRAMYPWRVQS